MARERTMKPVCVATMKELDRLRDLAGDHELTIRYSEVRCRRNRKTLHVMFEKAGIRVLDYWPGSGRIWHQPTGTRGKVVDVWDALEKAAEIASEM